eukprot:14302417-Ditylum_brightwellii.AAC.1
MVEMLLRGKALQHWQRFKSQGTGLPILGVLDEEDEDNSGEGGNDKEKEKKDEGQSYTSAGTPT